ncbi:hypothetical protein LCGC14_0698780 [marine sediment metagenome]|uniref:Uncharacterized protein n=1 Tax=marine sediment metagenome TaxID=412755 RepID=A0A0F9QN41_9ZZZZ
MYSSPDLPPGLPVDLPPDLPPDLVPDLLPDLPMNLPVDWSSDLVCYRVGHLVCSGHAHSRTAVRGASINTWKTANRDPRKTRFASCHTVVVTRRRSHCSVVSHRLLCTIKLSCFVMFANTFLIRRTIFHLAYGAQVASLCHQYIHVFST